MHDFKSSLMSYTISRQLRTKWLSCLQRILLESVKTLFTVHELACTLGCTTALGQCSAWQTWKLIHHSCSLFPFPKPSSARSAVLFSLIQWLTTRVCLFFGTAAWSSRIHHNVFSQPLHKLFNMPTRIKSSTSFAISWYVTPKYYDISSTSAITDWRAAETRRKNRMFSTEPSGLLTVAW